MKLFAYDRPVARQQAQSANHAAHIASHHPHHSEHSSDLGALGGQIDGDGQRRRRSGRADEHGQDHGQSQEVFHSRNATSPQGVAP